MMTLLYVLMCVLWGIFAMRMHLKLNYPYRRVMIVGLLNMILAPLAIVFAIVRCPVNEMTVID